MRDSGSYDPAKLFFAEWGHTMTLKIKVILFAVLVCLLSSGTEGRAAEQMNLYADMINYDTNTQKIKVEGHVVLSRGRDRVYGDSGEGAVDKNVFAIKGNVTGIFPEYGAELKSADSLKWTGDSAQSSRRVIEANGKVHLTRGAKDYLKAQYVIWEAGFDNYTARGAVDARYSGYILKAAEANRSGDTFAALKVTRYEDIARKTTLAADRVDGKISGDEVSETIATGNVSIEYIDAEGLKTVLTGAKAVYSKALATVVVSGNAKAVRSDGKTVSSQTMVLYIDSKNVEATGNAKITFITDGKTGNKPSGATKTKGGAPK